MLIRTLLMAILLFLVVPMVGSTAPVQRTIADRFEITVQFQHEPAILGDTNGIRLQITENGEAITGAIDTLIVQVEYMEAVRVLTMYEDSTQPGVYTGVFIPMQTGEYSFVLQGSIDGVEVDERFTVADGLVPVTPRSDYEFPNAANGFGLQNLTLPIAATALVGFFIMRRSLRSPAP